ncbi:hypothetical protein [Mycobacterium palustre]|uniref:Uncharacterized protein n=1 Tax=Mycobacterium palustre TaxID=153971 RepID=A0A1X1ZCC7_9MYCO|nr:hypothetical protein [Mycobacterium palustre]ORW20936.1 hypothetical protein AWC19_14325 [Mycobacterium palustre]
MIVDSWAASLYRSVRNILPWPQFPGLFIKPPLRLEPTMTDDDVDFHGDMIYVRGLLDDLVEACRLRGHRVGPIPAELSAGLDAALILVHHDFVEGIAS